MGRCLSRWRSIASTGSHKKFVPPRSRGAIFSARPRERDILINHLSSHVVHYLSSSNCQDALPPPLSRPRFVYRSNNEVNKAPFFPCLSAAWGEGQIKGGRAAVTSAPSLCVESIGCFSSLELYKARFVLRGIGDTSTLTATQLHH